MNRTAFLAIALAFAAGPSASEPGVRGIPSSIAGAPDHLIPLSASQIADERLREIIGDKLAESLDLESDIDMARLEELAMLASQPATEAGIPSEVEAAEEVQMASDGLQGAQPALRDDLLQGLTLEQIQMMAIVLASLHDPAGARYPVQAGQAGNGGHGQALSGREVTLDATNGGASILLSGWDVAMLHDGTTELFQVESPGSRITLEPGLVIGALGPVVDIRRIGNEVHVHFGNGDSISGRAETMPAGIPPLPPISNTDQFDQEVLLSAPPQLATRSSEVISMTMPPALMGGTNPAPRPDNQSR